jgi:hypothetical protein
LTPSILHPSLFYDDTPATIEWLCRAFGFRRRLVEPGMLVVKQIVFDGTLLRMLGMGVAWVYRDPKRA